MNTNEVQKALDSMVDSIDIKVLGDVLARQSQRGPKCRHCGFIAKNLRGLSAHGRTHQ